MNLGSIRVFARRRALSGKRFQDRLGKTIFLLKYLKRREDKVMKRLCLHSEGAYKETHAPFYCLGNDKQLLLSFDLFIQAGSILYCCSAKVFCLCYTICEKNFKGAFYANI